MKNFDELKLVKSALAESIMEYYLEPPQKLPKTTSDYRVKQCCIIYALLEITKDLNSVPSFE